MSADRTSTIPYTASDRDQERAESYAELIADEDDETLLDMFDSGEDARESLAGWQLSIIRREILDRMPSARASA